MRCEEGFIGVEGVVDGTAVMFADGFGGPRPGGPGRPANWNYAIGQSGQLRAVVGMPLPKGRTSTAAMLARLPPDLPAGGDWLCGPSEVSRTQDRFTLTATAISILGTCADAAPAAGELRGCVGTAGGVSCRTLTGTVAGRSVDVDDYPYGAFLVRGAAPTRLFELSIADGAGLIEWDEAAGAGLMIMPAASAFDPGALYCVGAGQFTEGGGQVRFTVGALKRLGTCADGSAVSGRLDVCVQRGP